METIGVEAIQVPASGPAGRVRPLSPVHRRPGPLPAGSCSRCWPRWPASAVPSPGSPAAAAPPAAGPRAAVDAPAGDPAPAEAARWQDDPLWNDGRAEVSVFKATEPKYGLPRRFLAYFIVVAEDLRNDTLVKSDDPNPAAGLTRVLKLNQVYHYQAGIYPYDQMASVFLRLSDLAPVKESVTSHEWCGNAYLQLLNRAGKGTLRGFSYFDGEADLTQTLDLAGATLYDALPLALRALPLREGLRRSLRLVPQLLGNRAKPVAIADATVTVVGAETVATGIGPIEAWKVEVRHAGGIDTLWLEKGAPNRLLRWEQADGGTYLLENVRRLAYWTMHAEGDEKALFEKEAGPGRD